jgi:hypothetical protein
VNIPSYIVCEYCIILNVHKAFYTMFLYHGFRLGVRRAMTHALTPFDTQLQATPWASRGAAHASFRELLNLQMLEYYTFIFYAEP